MPRTESRNEGERNEAFPAGSLDWCGPVASACRLRMGAGHHALNGRVNDDSGAVLPGVTVSATQTHTTFTRTVVTDATTNYAMTNLPTGPYRLEMSLRLPHLRADRIVLQV